MLQSTFAGSKKRAELVKSMETLPAELVFQVLDNLSVYHTLKIACQENEWVNDCILSHGRYAALFPTAASFAETKRYFRLYDDLCTLQGVPKLANAKYSLLGANYEIRVPDPAPQPLQGYPPRPPVWLILRNYMFTSVRNALEDAQRWLPLLNAVIDVRDEPLRTVWGNTSLQDLEQRWHRFLAAEATLNSAKSSQLLRLADIVEENADLLLLSADAHAEREGRPFAAAHVSARFRFTAKRLRSPGQVFRRPRSGTRTPGAHLFCSNGLPLMPTQRSLKLLLRGLELYPCAGAAKVRRTRKNKIIIRNQHIDENENNDWGNSFHTYPDSIAQDIRTVVAGLAYIYTNPADPGIVTAFPLFHRTQDTPYSLRAAVYADGATADGRDARAEDRERKGDDDDDDGDEQQPRFCTPARKHAMTRLGLVKVNNGVPHDEREFQWLEAYLRVVRYFRDELGVE